MKGPVVLIVVDGFGIGTGGEEDATARALTPFFDRVRGLYPHATLQTSGNAVGLPEVERGNSEIGHRTMGAGRMIDGDTAESQRKLDVRKLERNPAFGELLSRAGLRQLRIAETERYPHVTRFFNGGREDPFSGEDRIRVPSPTDVPAYDVKPEMGAIEVTDRLLEALDRAEYAFVLVNYANPGMVAQTGVEQAVVRAVEVVDACLDRVTATVLARGGTLLITADPGNLELPVDPATGSRDTAHPADPVPIFWVTDLAQGRGITHGGLADVAPSLCKLIGIEVPEEMTGRCLLTGDPSFSNS